MIKLRKPLEIFLGLVYNNECKDERICGKCPHRESAVGVSRWVRVAFRFPSVRRRVEGQPLIAFKVTVLYRNLGGTTEFFVPFRAKNFFIL